MVFGFSFPELIVLMIVAIVVIGPKDLPKVLRRVGQWAGKLRRMASDIRAQSGIDDVLRGEGIAQDIQEIRKLARGELDNVTRAARLDLPAPAPPPRVNPYLSPTVEPSPADEIIVQREREYPREGADSYRALPDTALVYAGSLPASPLVRDALYMTGDPDGSLPAEADAAPPPLAATEADAAPPPNAAGDPAPEATAPDPAPVPASPADAQPDAATEHPPHDA